MNIEEKKLIETPEWQLYEKGKNYLRSINMYAETDKNYHMTYGDQWEGLVTSGIEKVSYPYIETIVGYKTSAICQNLWGINFSSENYDGSGFRKTAEKTCEMLNRKAAKTWEKDDLDHKVILWAEDSAVNAEALCYVDYDYELQLPINEVIYKNDICYGNEQSSDIQKQPYIIIKRRLPVIEIMRIAEKNGVEKAKLDMIVGDTDTSEETGENADREANDMAIILTKLWKESGKVQYSQSTRYCTIKETTNTKLSYYPLAHMLWKDKKGSARGYGETEKHIPNQIELNKTLMRQLLSVKQNAYPQKIVNTDKVTNIEAISQVGGIIKVSGSNVEDVNKVFSTTQPVQMSADVSKVINDLIQISRDLSNSGDIATGSINPEQASGKAILAVQKASQQPLTRQVMSLKTFIEHIARIWLDMWTTYSPNGLVLEEVQKDKQGKETIKTVKVPATVLDNLKASVKVDITPKSSFDKYAQELSLENLLQGGYFNLQRLNELEIYANALADDSVMPKQKLLDIIADMKKQQAEISEINARGQMMQQKANQFLNNDPTTQAAQMAQALPTT